MIFADKLIDLRKKNGWSQEDLADKLDVSRQSISKWESAQSVPDMNRILKLSELFGVSTDYLLKDELGPEAIGSELVSIPDTDSPVRRVSLEEATAYLAHRAFAARRIALGVLLCILSPILLIILGGAQEAGKLRLTEAQVGGIGMVALMLLVAAAVALFVLTGLKGSRFQYLEKEAIETAYGVDGMVRDRREKFRGSYNLRLTLGILLCVLSIVPLFLCVIFFGEGNSPAESFPHVLSMGALLALVGAGVYLTVHACTVWGGFQVLLEEGDYSRAKKATGMGNGPDPVAVTYWSIVTAIYLAWSFLGWAWGISWVIWPVAAVLFGAVLAIRRLPKKKQ